MCKASVIMSVYKERVDWLSQAIDSILTQTFKDYEFIIICDNPDYNEGIELLQEYAELDNRIQLIFNDENIGLTKSLNKGIKKAKAEYIIRMDADDISLPKRFEKQVAFMDKHPYIVASGTAVYMWSDTNYKRNHRKTKNIDLRSRIIFDSPIYHPSAIFRRVVEGNLILYNESFKYSQDYALWISLINQYELSNIDEPLLKYRISDQQISTSRHGEQREYALRNQRNAINLLNLNLTENEIDFCQDITRRIEINHEQNEVSGFIEKFMSKIKGRDDLNYAVIASQWLLIYVNRIAKTKNLVNCIFDYFKICSHIGIFSMYSFLSLICKYIKK